MFPPSASASRRRHRSNRSSSRRHDLDAESMLVQYSQNNAPLDRATNQLRGNNEGLHLWMRGRGCYPGNWHVSQEGQSRLASMNGVGGYGTIGGMEDDISPDPLTRRSLLGPTTPPRWFTEWLILNSSPQCHDDGLGCRQRNCALRGSGMHSPLHPRDMDTLMRRRLLPPGLGPLHRSDSMHYLGQDLGHQWSPHLARGHAQQYVPMADVGLGTGYRAPYAESDYASDVADAEYQRRLWEEFVATTGADGVMYEAGPYDGRLLRDCAQHRRLLRE